MRRTTCLLALSILFLTSVGYAQENAKKESPFTVKGKLPASFEKDTVVLTYYSAKGKERDSVIVKNGIFEIRGKSPRIQKAYLYDLRDYYDMQTIYLEPGANLTATSNGHGWQSVKVTGGPIQTDWVILEKEKASLTEQAKTLSAKTRSKQHLTVQEQSTYDAAIGVVYDKIVKVENAYIAKHPASYVSWDIVQNRSIIVENPEELESLFNMLDEKYKNTPAGKGVISRLLAARTNAVGRKATDFVSVDTLGHEVSLASMKGKYVLVDFWASWCGFCRYQTPTLKKVYDKYKNKNFTIVSVSYDDSKDKWMKAIHEDKMPWNQVSELKGMGKAPSAKQYGITAIPQNVLLDPNGVIIAKNIRLDEFDKKIGEVIGAIH